MKIFTDGACRGNPGPGGFGVVCVHNNEIKYQHSEYSDDTTNNREELKAILHTLEMINVAYEESTSEEFIICSDSAYCVNMINNWIWTWANNGWLNSKKQIVENVDLVKQIYKYINKDFFPCQVVKVKGHCGNMENELADALATGDKIKYQKLLKKYSLEGNYVL